MSDILSLIKKKRIFFDGGTGTYLQSKGLVPGEKPEMWNITKPEVITELHRKYFECGCNIVSTNTFGVNPAKFENYKEIISAAVACANKAREGLSEKFIAFDMGPTGRLLEPYGDMKFEECVELYAENIRCASKCGVDLIIIETMNDALETKAAVLAAKENCDLPVFVTNVYDGSGKLMTGADPISMIALLEGLGVDALGMNCSFGPEQMLGIIDVFAKYASVPVIVNPNAGLPTVVDGKTCYDLTPEEFAAKSKLLAERGATILGGCCGTTPEYIGKMIEAVKDVPYKLPEYKNYTIVSSYTHAVVSKEKTVLIGERINPTGKSKLKEAIKNEDMDYILGEGLKQADFVDVLDVNMGVPGIDEPYMMEKTVKALQAVTDLPLQIDSSNPDALESAMRIYAGKPMVNSVNGKQESLDSVLPLVKKYGGVLIALTLDENGIPDTADGRVAIAKRIITEAAKYGIGVKDIVVDPLALTVSSDKDSALVTLKAIEALHGMGIRTSLGVSNISFGLPQRELINQTFFTLAMEKGLDFAIMNPFSRGMMNSYHTFNTLHGLDEACADYIAYASSFKSAADSVSQKASAVPSSQDAESLENAVIKGLKDKAEALCAKALENTEPLEVINTMIVPALNRIGEDFEKGKAFLPQLLMSADAASAAFEKVKAKIGSGNADDGKKIVLATVKGDIHDIGKDIVRVLLESYGFTVIDIGRDVKPEDVVKAAKESGCTLVGLSALMTTTVPAMEETIKLLRAELPEIKVMVGGAVLNAEYAKEIGADFYGKDAMEAVKIAKSCYEK